MEESARFLSFHELSELMQALPGFVMLLTGEGKLLYLSDSVSEHLGHSMVSLTRIQLLFLGTYFVFLHVTFFSWEFQVDLVSQGDSVYDIIDASDHFIMRSNLSTTTSLEMGKIKYLIIFFINTDEKI